MRVRLWYLTFSGSESYSTVIYTIVQLFLSKRYLQDIIREFVEREKDNGEKIWGKSDAGK